MMSQVSSQIPPFCKARYPLNLVTRSRVSCLALAGPDGSSPRVLRQTQHLLADSCLESNKFGTSSVLATSLWVVCSSDRKWYI